MRVQYSSEFEFSKPVYAQTPTRVHARAPDNVFVLSQGNEGILLTNLLFTITGNLN